MKRTECEAPQGVRNDSNYLANRQSSKRASLRPITLDAVGGWQSRLPGIPHALRYLVARKRRVIGFRRGTFRHFNAALPPSVFRPS